MKYAPTHQKCFYCATTLVVVTRGTAFTPKGMEYPPNLKTREHLRRKADGGGNARWNITYACYDCNTSRGTMSWQTYKERKAANNE